MSNDLASPQRDDNVSFDQETQCFDFTVRIDDIDFVVQSVARSDCDSYEKILGLITHLGGKSEITSNHLAVFVRSAAREHNLEITF